MLSTCNNTNTSRSGGGGGSSNSNRMKSRSVQSLILQDDNDAKNAYVNTRRRVCSYTTRTDRLTRRRQQQSTVITASPPRHISSTRSDIKPFSHPCHRNHLLHPLPLERRRGSAAGEEERLFQKRRRRRTGTTSIRSSISRNTTTTTTTMSSLTVSKLLIFNLCLVVNVIRPFTLLLVDGWTLPSPSPSTTRSRRSWRSNSCLAASSSCPTAVPAATVDSIVSSLPSTLADNINHKHKHNRNRYSASSWTMTLDQSSSSSTLPPSMLLGSRNSVIGTSRMSSSVLQRPTPQHIGTVDTGSSIEAIHLTEQRRVLGFDIFELDATRQPQQYEQYEDQQRSNSSRRRGRGGGGGDAKSRYRNRNRNNNGRPVKVDIDLQTWEKNGAGKTLEEMMELDEISSRSGNFFPIPPFHQFASSSSSSGNNSPLRPSVLPAWFPWVPTKSQIQSLKLTELKEACAQRGLTKTGNKLILQDRLWEWTNDHQYQHQARIAGDYLTNWFEGMANHDAAAVDRLGTNTTNNRLASDNSRYDDRVATSSADVEENRYNEFGFPTSPTAAEADNTTPNSLAEWSRTVNLDKLLDKRKEIHRQKREGKKLSVKPSKSIKRDRHALATAEGTREYLNKLTKTLQSSPSSPYASNKDAKEIYLASKEADQLGEPGLAIQLLESLLEITPKDARVYRRLSRLHREQGDLDQAQATLQDGLRQMPDNAWLWHGLGQLEMSKGKTDLGVRCYQRAIKEDPTFAHAYHAWGIHEHSQGQIAKAMKILKKGVEYCPTNHRLHHALGDIYRGAKMLADADRSYRRALREGPPVSHGFAFSALASVSYELGDGTETRRWLHRSIENNNGRHANGWLALAQLEEAEGNTDEAIQVCRKSIIQYERGLLEARQRFRQKSRKSQAYRSESLNEYSPINKPIRPLTMSTNAEDVKDELLASVPTYRSGDKFINVFRHWIRLENEYGTFESANKVYERAVKAFPKDYRLPLGFAEYQANIKNAERARTLFLDACSKASNVDARPFSKHAVFEMNLGNYEQAQKILFRGAQSLSKSSEGGVGNQQGLTELFLTWAFCEWHLGNIDRSETLFDHALRLVDPSEGGSELRAFILYCFAVLEHTEQNELLLAQHCIGLSLKEGQLPGGTEAAWKLWADIADEMGNTKLSNNCQDIAEKCEQQRAASSSVLSAADLIKQSQMAGQFQPWQEKLQRQKGRNGLDTGRSLSAFYSTLKFPHHVMERLETVPDSMRRNEVVQ